MKIIYDSTTIKRLLVKSGTDNLLRLDIIDVSPQHKNYHIFVHDLFGDFQRQLVRFLALDHFDRKKNAVRVGFLSKAEVWE